MSVSAIKEKDWVFHALWAASGPRTSLRYSIMKLYVLRCLGRFSYFIYFFYLRCNVAIPLTILFRNGTPYKGLGFEGYIKRVNLDEIASTSYVREARKITGSSNKLFRVCRSLLLEFVRSNSNIENYEDFDDNTKFCSAVYQDGEREDITLRKFDLLIRNETWRKQVIFVQGYVTPISTQSGFFGSKKKVRIICHCVLFCIIDPFHENTDVALGALVIR